MTKQKKKNPKALLIVHQKTYLHELLGVNCNLFLGECQKWSSTHQSTNNNPDASRNPIKKYNCKKRSLTLIVLLQQNWKVIKGQGAPKKRVASTTSHILWFHVQNINKLLKKTRRFEIQATFDTSASHSPPTPRNAWTPWASLIAPRGPVLIDVWIISSTSLGRFSMLSESRIICKLKDKYIAERKTYGWNWNESIHITVLDNNDNNSSMILCHFLFVLVTKAIMFPKLKQIILKRLQLLHKIN